MRVDELDEVQRLRMLTRKCSRCGAVKPWSEFPIQKRNEDGSVRTVLSTCKRCKTRLQKDWEDRNVDLVRANKARWARAKHAALRADQHSDRYLPIGPLADFLERLPDTPEDWAPQIGYAGPEGLRRLLKRRDPTVSMRKADLIITRLGGVFSLIYPEDGD